MLTPLSHAASGRRAAAVYNRLVLLALAENALARQQTGATKARKAS